jgi:hypothetical protein
MGFFTRTPEQLSLHFYDFPVILYRFYKAQLVNPKFVDVILQKGPPIEDLRLQSGPGGGARLASGEGWPDSGEQAARVGFGLTLSRLAGLAWRNTTPAMVGGEGGRRTAAATAMPASWRFGRSRGACGGKGGA